MIKFVSENQHKSLNINSFKLMKNTLILFGLVLFCSEMLSSQIMIGIKIGASVINLETIEYKNDSLLFINLHSDEVTSIKAVKQILPKAFGKYMGLQSGGTREVSFTNNGKTIKFDPNRIYTKTGIEKTLTKYQCYSKLNSKMVETFSAELLKYFTKHKLLVAVHNNSNGGFSINSLQNESKTKKDILEIFVNPDKDEDDFYYVTEKSKFDYFKFKGYNVVLQDNKYVGDDGSLSVYCGRRNISYINIECQIGHLDEQIKMIQEIYAGFFPDSGFN
jgi:hypothetical protein